MRRLAILCSTGLIAGLGCGLLQPYPGDTDPRDLFSELGQDGGPGGGVDPSRGTPGQQQPPPDPLVDPDTDDSIRAETPNEVVVANPGEAMLLKVEFQALNRNVLGAGIRFEGSDEVQWTLIASLEGEQAGTIEFAYSLPDGLCDDVPNLCHELRAELFAVGRRASDGAFVVSPPARPYDGKDMQDRPIYVEENGAPREDIRVVLRCASCDSDTCRDLLGAECSQCAQPQECAEVFDLCFGPGRPKEDATGEKDIFNASYGPDGLIWRVPGICTEVDGTTPADELCKELLFEAQDPNDPDNCLGPDMGDTDGGTGGMGG